MPELEELPLDWFAGTHSFLCRAQSLGKVNGEARERDIEAYLMEMLRSAIPSALTAAAPHGGRATAEGTWVVDDRDGSVHGGSTGSQVKRMSRE